MNLIDVPLFFQKNKAKELNDTIFTNTGCFLFLKIGDFPFMNSCENYRQALYSLIIDAYVLFHDYGRKFWIAFAKVSHTKAPDVLDDLIKYRIVLTHSQFEPEIQVLNSFSRLITTNNVTSIEDFYVKLSNANNKDYELAYNTLKNELNMFYFALNGIINSSIKNNFCDYCPQNNRRNTFTLSLNEALIKSILQAESGDERPTYSSYCKNGKVNINHFQPVQQIIIDKFKKNKYNSPDDIYPDFRNEVINTVKPPQPSSAVLLNSLSVP